MKTGKEISENDKAAKLKAALKTVKNYTVSSMGTGFIPVPIMDQIVLMGIQQKMLRSLAELYNVPFSESIAKSIIKSMLKGVATRAMLSSFIKFIPVGGTAVGTASSLAFNGASTYALGRVFIRHFESGGTLLTFEADKFKKHFTAEYEKGKEKAREFYKK
ncbi:MAG: DUF697 domain-containing protein [Gammaproteobacteria bacterium]|nr:DUF697 domain-containing protein [Gammaproteobacteria bacterium]